MVLIAALGTLFPAPLRAQAPQLPVRVELGVEPREVTVGDPFRSVVRVIVPEGFELRYREFESGDSIAATAPVSIARDGEGLVAWAVAPEFGAAATIEITGPDGTTRVEDIRLQLPRVATVLPAGDEEVVPRPPRGPIDPIEPAFPWWLLAVLLAVLLGYLLYRYLRRRPERPIEADPRAWALEQLSGEAMRRLVDRGDAARVIEYVGHTIRAYIARVDDGFGRDLTTSELLDRLRARPGPFSGSTITAPNEQPPIVDPGGSELLMSILHLADGVKFARQTPSIEIARKALDSARGWIERYPPPVQVEAARRAA